MKIQENLKSSQDLNSLQLFKIINCPFGLQN
jgi:hypothetical protein